MDKTKRAEIAREAEWLCRMSRDRYMESRRAPKDEKEALLEACRKLEAESFRLVSVLWGEKMARLNNFLREEDIALLLGKGCCCESAMVKVGFRPLEIDTEHSCDNEATLL
jgi:hypothetical protein